MDNNFKIFVNLPVKNLINSIDFFTKMGFSFNPLFTNKNATCMVLGESIYVMLLIEDFFKTFTTKKIADTSNTTEVIVALQVSSKEAVDLLVKKAFAAGAKEFNKPSDHGYMYSWSFQDLDNHLWEILYMDTNQINQEIK